MSSGLFRGARQRLAALRPMRVPDEPARPFRDLWSGSAARGARLLGGAYERSGVARPLRPGPEGAQDWAAGPPAWRAAAHGFAWLRDLRELGSDAARLRARDLTADWLARAGADPIAAQPEVAGARLSAWLGHWEFLAATAEPAFRRAVMQRLAHDARALVAGLPAEAAHRGALVALKGAVAAAVALDDEAWMQRCLRLLPAELERQFHLDGGHVERSPGQHLLAVQDLIELRNLLHGAEAETPATLPVALERAAQALRLYRHPDGGLALFNGTRDEGAADGLVDLVLAQSQIRGRGRGPASLGETGFCRLQAGPLLAIVDCGPPPPARARGGPLPRGADRLAHAGTLAFELSVGRQRVVVNCGAAPAADPPWRDALRATAAHSTLVLADTNAAELRDEGLGRRPQQVVVELHEAEGAQWLNATHDGWAAPFGALHRRRLYLAESGHDLRGEDEVEGEGAPAFAVRFHLHPDVTAEPRDEGTVRLGLPGGAAWTLRARGGRMAVEESVYLGAASGTAGADAAAGTGSRVPRPSRQVVVYAAAGAGPIHWGFAPAGTGQEAGRGGDQGTSQRTGRASGQATDPGVEPGAVRGAADAGGD